MISNLKTDISPPPYYVTHHKKHTHGVKSWVYFRCTCLISFSKSFIGCPSWGLLGCRRFPRRWRRRRRRFFFFSYRISFLENKNKLISTIHYFSLWKSENLGWKASFSSLEHLMKFWVITIILKHYYSWMELTSHPPVMMRAFLPDWGKKGSAGCFLFRRKVEGSRLLLVWRILSFSLKTTNIDMAWDPPGCWNQDISLNEEPETTNLPSSAGHLFSSCFTLVIKPWGCLPVNGQNIVQAGTYS